ncbi:MAG: transglutaminaseTgpA domain-containing protein [Bryobacteraceae bacterium]
MSRSVANAAVSVERFFQFALWGLVASGYLAVAGSGYLDTPTIILTGAGLLLRALLIAGWVHFTISPNLVTVLTLAYVGFFPLDYLYFSGHFVESTVHLVFFLAVIKILTSTTSRDYFFMGTIAFLELLAAAILSSNSNFFLFLALYLFFAMAAFTSAEIRRSMQKPQMLARSGLRRFHPRLAALTAAVTFLILSLTAGLFFMLPRTADAAFHRMIAKRFYLPGFSNQVNLGEIGEIKATSRPVMHVRFDQPGAPAALKWRGATLSDFNGRSWFDTSANTQEIPPGERSTFTLANEQSFRARGNLLHYTVTVNGIDSDALFFAGTPTVVYLMPRQKFLRTRGDGTFRLGRQPADTFFYEAYSYLDAHEAPGPDRQADARARYLKLPPALDPHISELAHKVTEQSESDAARAIAVASFLRENYGYTLELPSHELADPLANFLFERKKGHCEYFASAMAVMLRTLGVPTRLVTGFQSGILNPLTDLYVIRASDAHSWVEAWLPGRGWVTFDPTPPDPNPASASLLTRLALYADAADTFWQEWVVSYDLLHQANLAEKVEQASRSASMRWLSHVFDSAEYWKPRMEYWLTHYALWIILMMAAGALGTWGGPQLWRIWRTRLGVWRLRRGQASVADATLLYQRMLKLLKRRGYQKPAWFTPHEFASSLPQSQLGSLVMQFTAAYNALRFGGDAEAAPQLSALLVELEKQGR